MRAAASLPTAPTIMSLKGSSYYLVFQTWRTTGAITFKHQQQFEREKHHQRCHPRQYHWTHRTNSSRSKCNRNRSSSSSSVYNSVHNSVHNSSHHPKREVHRLELRSALSSRYHKFKYLLRVGDQHEKDIFEKKTIFYLLYYYYYIQKT